MASMSNVRFEGNIAILEMTNGKNAFNHSFLDNLNESLDKVLSNEDAHALITYGTGKHFSDGIALAEAYAEGTLAGMGFMLKLAKLFVRWLTFPMPTFAAVNGHAFAGGCIFVMAHDYKVMDANRGWLCLPEAHMPQMFPVTLMEIIKCKTPPGIARREFITMGKRISGPEAVKLGVVDRTASTASLLDDTIKYAQESLKMGSYDRQAMQDMKNHVYENVVQACSGMYNFNYMPPYMLKSQV